MIYHKCSSCDIAFNYPSPGKNICWECYFKKETQRKTESENRKQIIVWSKCPKQTGYIVGSYFEKNTRRVILQHRYIMEQHLARKLKSSEHVHHINEIPSDNRIENLQIVTAMEHRKIHAELRKINGTRYKLKHRNHEKNGRNRNPAKN